MMSRIPVYCLCLFGGLLTSCSLFREAPVEEKPAVKEEKPVAVPQPVAPLPGGEPSLMPVSAPLDPMLPLIRPGLREPDITSSLPLNLDGSAVKTATPDTTAE